MFRLIMHNIILYITSGVNKRYINIIEKFVMQPDAVVCTENEIRSVYGFESYFNNFLHLTLRNQISI